MTPKKIFICILLGICTYGCKDKKRAYLIDEITPPLGDSVVSMTFTGDLLFEQGLYDSLDDYDFGTYFDQIKPYLKGDIVIGNQEIPIGGEELGVSGVAFTFNAPKKVADQLPEIGFDIMSVATNHSYDMGYQGVFNTLKHLHDNGIATFGLYAQKEDKDQIYVIEKHGIRIALLAYTYDTNEWIEPEHDYVVKTFLNEQRVLDDEKREMLREDVEKAKEQADVVIAAMHWGNEFTYTLNQAQLETADYLNELGVDLIIGNHPHNIQTMEELINETNAHRTIVFYSLGNFVSAAAMVDRASIEFANMYEVGAILNLDIVKDRDSGEITIQHMVITPIINHFEHGYTNFALIPFSDYSEELASQHYQREFSEQFNREWIAAQLHDLFDGKITLAM